MIARLRPLEKGFDDRCFYELFNAVFCFAKSNDERSPNDANLIGAVWDITRSVRDLVLHSRCAIVRENLLNASQRERIERWINALELVSSRIALQSDTAFSMLPLVGFLADEEIALTPFEEFICLCLVSFEDFIQLECLRVLLARNQKVSPLLREAIRRAREIGTAEVIAEIERLRL